MKKLILGIETSCDETGLALIEASGGLKSPKFKILKNLVASQVKVHKPYGGVVPNLAKREHLKNLPILYKKLVAKPYTLDPDLVAVTVGPGLEPALWTGIGFAKQLCNQQLTKNNKKIQLVGTNHLEGHLYSFLIPKKTESTKFEARNSDLFPAVALIVSGGHTVLLLMKDLKTWKKLGETRDDAVGEAFDKVARLLNLPYPGGPALEKLARKGNGLAIEFPRPMIHEKNYDFSFSGLKTSVLYHLRDLGHSALKASSSKRYSHQPLATRVNMEKSLNPIPQTLMADIAASFQAATIEVLVKKTMRAAREFEAKSVMLSGGVAANKALRAELKKESKRIGVDFLVAEQKYNTDNAVMIAAAGYMAYLRKKKYPLRANGNLEI